MECSVGKCVVLVVGATLSEFVGLALRKPAGAEEGSTNDGGVGSDDGFGLCADGNGNVCAVGTNGR